MPFTPYDYPAPDSIIGLVTYPSSLIGDAWAGIILAVIWLILTVSINQFERITNILESVAASSFVTAMLALLLAGSGIITAYVDIFPIILTALSSAILFIGRK